MNPHLVPGLANARGLAARENGLAVAITTRSTGLPRASVVNAGVLDHPVTDETMVAFVSRGTARKLDDLRHRPNITVVFRSAWETGRPRRCDGSGHRQGMIRDIGKVLR